MILFDRRFCENPECRSTELRAKVQKMEDDMAKIRREIGDGEWRRIVELQGE